MSWIAVLLALFSAVGFNSPLGAQGRAEVLRAVARIEQISPGANPSRAVIVSRGRGRRPAHVYDYLFRGDRLVLTGQSTSVVIRRTGIAGTQTIFAETNSVVDFGDSPPPSVSTRLASLVAGLGYWWRDGNRNIPTEWAARSLDPQSLDIGGRPPAPLRRLLAPRQLIAMNRTLIVPVWAGDAVRLTVEDDRGTEVRRSLVIGKYATRMQLDARVPRARLVLSGIGGGSEPIEVVRAPDPQMPAWIAQIRQPEEARLATAAWLALEGPAEWRLEGYTRLTELAELDLAAMSVWEAVTMEWVVGRRR